MVVRGRAVTWKRLVALGALAGLGLLVLIQAVPYGRAHSNPPVTAEPRWDSPRTRELARRACFDCHSNETNWRWYSWVAPASWLLTNDVNGGRETLNFSEWNRPQDADLNEVVEAIQSGSMPPWYYRLPHPTARLSSSEKADLVNGLRKTWATSPPG